MTYEQASTLAGHLPSWELRAAIGQAYEAPKLTSRHEERFALAALVVLKFRKAHDATFPA